MLGSKITLSEPKLMLPENWSRDSLALFHGMMGGRKIVPLQDRLLRLVGAQGDSFGLNKLV